eukprot:TRINITY_DN2516_c0_g1_i3.p1 TRINITY_DN2516_c0_g1~~TRINITY_DN2516_c0_g1_i3.p1  ORF type:complete len:125 (+),score=8.36 TRINITY_DN2516_c0_g1_i3:34-408(+)
MHFSHIQLFTSVSVIPDYAIAYGIAGFVASFVGQTLLNWVVRKTNRKSFIIFSIVAVIGFSTILLGFTGVMNFVRSVNNGAYLGFNENQKKRKRKQFPRVKPSPPKPVNKHLQTKPITKIPRPK